MDAFELQHSLANLELRYQALLDTGKRYKAENAGLSLRLDQAKAEFLEYKSSNDFRLIELEERNKALERDVQALIGEKEDLRCQLSELAAEKSRLETDLIDTREIARLRLLQLHQVQDELESLSSHSSRQAEKLTWLRGQRESLINALRDGTDLLHNLSINHGKTVLSLLKQSNCSIGSASKKYVK